MADAPLVQYPLGVAGIVTRVLEQGSGPRAVLFLHGLGARADRWRTTLAAVAGAGYRGIAFDFPGHGLATKGPDVPCTVPRLAEVATAVLDALGIGAASLVGTSLGGHVAGNVAVTSPERVDRLVLVGSLGLVRRPDLVPPIADAVRRRSREDVEAKLRRVFAATGGLTDAFVTEEWRCTTSPGAGESLDAYAAALEAGDSEALVADGLREREVLLVWGRDDRSVPVDVGVAAHAALPASRLVVIDGAGHAPYLEQPGEFAAALLAHLAA